MYWTVHLEGGPRRVNHAASVVGDKIYSFGGYCTGENYQRSRPMDVHVLHTENYRWTAIQLFPNCDPNCIPYQRYGHTAVTYGKKIYIWGGRNDEVACNKLYCFDTVSLEWSCPNVKGFIPAARDGHSACVINNYMYIFGGFEELLDKYSQDVYVLDFRTMQWKYLVTQGNPPSYRDFHSASAFGTNMYIFGGRGDSYGPTLSQEELYCSHIMYLDTVSGRWHRPATSGTRPCGRRSHSAFTHGGYLYIFGGFNGLSKLHFNDLHRFSPATNEWQLVQTHGDSPNPRRRQSCVVVNDRVFLFGGTSPYPDYVEEENFLPVEVGPDAKLMDHSDLHVLDLNPRLRTLCLATVIRFQLNPCWLPDELKKELEYMTKNNTITTLFICTG